MKAKQLKDNTIPENPGEYSVQHLVSRPPYGDRMEIYIMTPNGRLGALIPEHHSWKFEENKLTVSPSIVYFDYHGFLRKDNWS
jgi:hypothetical protein